MVIRDDHDRGNNRGDVARADASTKAPEEVLSPWCEMVDEIDVKRIARLREVGLFSVRSVVISLQLNVGPCTQHAPPPTNEIAPRKLRILFHVGHRGRRVCRDPHALSVVTVVEVTLKRQGVASVQIPICSETGLSHSPIIKLSSIRVKLGTSSESPSVDPVIKVLVFPASIPETDKALIDVSAAAGRECSVRIFCAFGDDVDDPVDSICAPDGTAGSPDDFDPVDILEQCVLDLPINAGKKRRVNGPAVDEHEY